MTSTLDETFLQAAIEEAKKGLAEGEPLPAADAGGRPENLGRGRGVRHQPWVMQEFDDGNYFASIVEEYLAAGHGRTGLVGTARSYLLDAQELTAFDVAWMERAFG